MRINKLLDVEVLEDGGLRYSFPTTAETYDDKISGPLLELFPGEGRYIFKVDVAAENYKGSKCLIKNAWKHSDNIDYTETTIVGVLDLLISKIPGSHDYLIESRDGEKGLIEKSNPLYKIIPYIPKDKKFPICFRLRQKFSKESRCPTNKQIFLSYYDAKIAAREKDSRERMKAIYRCKSCGFWHLTTKDGQFERSRKETYNRDKEKRRLYRQIRLKLSEIT